MSENKFLKCLDVKIGKPHALVLGKKEIVDKMCNIQFQGLNKDQKQMLKLVFTNEVVNIAKPFIQGDYDDWLMIEFFSSDLNLVEKACSHLINSIDIDEKNVPGMKHKDFENIFKKD